MGELASAGQLRMSFARWALVCVPMLLLAGMLSGRLAGSGNGNPWYAALNKSAAVPPAWAFPVAWGLLYILMGLALAMVLNARGARGRSAGLALFAVQIALNLAWSPLVFAGHQLWGGLAVIGLMLLAAIATTVAFAQVRRRAAWLLVPYLCWLSFAGGLNYRLAADNPGASSLAPDGASAQIR